MFLKTLPVVPVQPSTGKLPESGTVTSFFLPKLMESGFGIPVRELEGDYLPEMQQRLEALCAVEPAASRFSSSLSSLRNTPVQFSTSLRKLHPTPGKITSPHMVTWYAAREMVDLLLLMDEHSLDPRDSDERDCQRMTFLPEFIPYMSILHGLEMTGVVPGIRYDYDIALEENQYPKHADVRTILVDRYRIYEDPKSFNETPVSVLSGFDAGGVIDADAIPLKRFFEEAYSRNDPDELRGFETRSNTAASHNVGGRDHAVAQVTVVKAID